MSSAIVQANKPNNDKIRELFIKQRKTLIAVSVLLVLFHYSGISISLDGLKVFGLEMKGLNVLHISFLLWLSWFYFLLRYYQYFRDLPDKGIKNALDTRLTLNLKRIAFKEFQKSFSFEDLNYKNPPGVDGKVLSHELKLNEDKSIVLQIEEKFIGVELTADVLIHTESGGGYQTTGNKVTISEGNLRKAKLHSLLWLSFNSHFVSEYFLPFAIAVAPVIWLIFN
jgi:hypothetical protein